MMIQNKSIVSHATLAASAQLVVAIMGRLSGNGVTDSIAGNQVYRTTVAAGALAQATTELRGLKD